MLRSASSATTVREVWLETPVTAKPDVAAVPATRKSLARIVPARASAATRMRYVMITLAPIASRPPAVAFAPSPTRSVRDPAANVAVAPLSGTDWPSTLRLPGT